MVKVRNWGCHFWRSPSQVAVFGSGSFGTAMASVVARNGFDVEILCRRAEVAESINSNHKNPNYLTEVGTKAVPHFALNFN